MHCPTTEKLKRLGLDTGFLAWLEGPGDRVPRLERLGKVCREQLAAAINAAGLLSSFQTVPEEWRSRYSDLKNFLLQCLIEKWVPMRNWNDDLACLDDVLHELLPKAQWKQFRDAIRRQSNLLCPPNLIKALRNAPRERPNKRESEQTQRMRAAVIYVGTVSRTKYIDLANFWNECNRCKYAAGTIRDRLRKGHPFDRTPEAAMRFLEFWMHVYAGHPHGRPISQK